MNSTAAKVSLAGWLVCSSSFAQQIQVTGPLAGAQAVSRTSESSRRAEGIVVPSGTAEVSGEMAFITADPSPSFSALSFTDVGLLRLRARRAFADDFELLVGTSLLAKQPSGSGEPVWQGGALGARLALSSHFASVMEGGGGPMLGSAGVWWQAASGFEFKTSAERELRFALNAGGVVTVLDFDEETEQSFWMEEVGLGAEAQLGRDKAAAWLRLDYDIPVASNPDVEHPDRFTGRALDPQVRLSLEVGGILTPTENWSVYSTFRVIDRGELSRPSTTLPILDGGFDQRQITIGVQHRFDPGDERQMGALPRSGG